MVKKVVLWKKMWETMRESMFKKCVQNCGKVSKWNSRVGKWGFSTWFLEVLRDDLNNKFTSVKSIVFHDFHIAYNYYYK